MNKTIIKDLHVDLETGNIQVLLHKRVLDDEGNVIAQGNHRTVIHPDTDIDATAKAINDHLASGRVPVNSETGGGRAVPIDLHEWEAVRAHAGLVHTPAIKKQWAEKLVAQKASLTPAE